MSTKGIKFGTDGWRGLIAEDFTFANLRLVAQALSDYMKHSPPPLSSRSLKMAVGYDTRFLSPEFALTLSEVLAANGIKVILSDRAVPVPVLCFGIKERGLAGGVMITASHNPPRFNGLKFKTHLGGPAEVDITQGIEKLIGKNAVKIMPWRKAESIGRIERLNYVPRYLKFIRSYIDWGLLKKSRFKIAVDTMHGMGDGYIAAILEKSMCKVTTIHQEPDPLFGGRGPEPIEKNLPELSSMLKNGRFDIGLATDGDGDRIGAMRPDGKFITPGWILGLLLLHFIEHRGWGGEVATTISNTALVESITRCYGLKLHETPVGFKYIAKLMQERDILIGGEESGGIGVKNYIPERDGSLLGILLLEMLAAREKGVIKIIDEVSRRFGKFYSSRRDLEYPDEMKKLLFSRLKKKPPRDLGGKKIVQVKDWDGMKFIARDGSWLLFRLSGTEPILRIYAEAGSKGRAEKLIQLGRELAFWK